MADPLAVAERSVVVREQLASPWELRLTFHKDQSKVPFGRLGSWPETFMRKPLDFPCNACA